MQISRGNIDVELFRWAWEVIWWSEVWPDLTVIHNDDFIKLSGKDAERFDWQVRNAIASEIKLRTREENNYYFNQ